MSLEYRVGDVFDRLAEIPDGSIDLIVTSPPFLALRSYLPADHPDKGKEIGSEATPADFLDTLLALSAEWGRVLAAHGSLCVELGDTYSGSGQSGWERNAPGYGGAALAQAGRDGYLGAVRDTSSGWPLAKSRTMIDTLYPACLAYGRNLLSGTLSPAGQWRIRNLIVWARPNPPVGALGDKFRPATSYITVACRGVKRYFDLDAVRTEYSPNSHPRTAELIDVQDRSAKTSPDGNRATLADVNNNGAGAPPLDWHTDHHPEDGDWLWKMSTQPYSGSHYATFPMALPKRLIEAMCPLRVCTVCGRPSERIVQADRVALIRNGQKKSSGRTTDPNFAEEGHTTYTTLGWSECGHDQWRTGIVLDPFAGSGTTLDAAQAVGRHAIGIDLDHRNADLARDRVGMFLEIVA